MFIASMPPKVGFQPTQKSPDPNQPPPNQTGSITQKIVDATVDNTLAATDRLVGTLAGMGTGTAAYLSKLPTVAAGAARGALNLIQSEVIGPNIKVIAGLATPLIVAAGLVGAGVGLAINVVAGAVRGFQAHDSEKPREFTINKAVDTAWTRARGSMDKLAQGMIESSAEVKAQKLAEGEDPWDIPLPPFGRTAKTMAATVAGLAIGGAGGVATALATTGSQAWGGIQQLGKGAPLAGLASVVASPVTGVLHGASKVFTTPVEAAAVAWKEKSLGGALKAAGQECFDAQPGKFSSAAGALVGGAVAALPSAATAAVVTTASNLSNGVKTLANDAELGLAGKALGTLGAVVTAPASGLAHAAATAVTTPFRTAASGWNHKSLAEGMAEGVAAGRSSTRPFGDVLGTFVGGVAVGGVSAVSATAAGLVSEVGGGLIETATNKELNLRGKLLAGVGAVPGDVITALGQGVGTLVYTPFKAAQATLEQESAGAGIKAGAQHGSRAVAVAARPQNTMVE